MTKIKNIEGAVPVDGDITPITRRKIDQIDAANWSSMSVNELTDQRIILQNRIIAAQCSGNGSLISQLRMGLAQLDGLIQQRGSIKSEDRLI